MSGESDDGFGCMDGLLHVTFSTTFQEKCWKLSTLIRSIIALQAFLLAEDLLPRQVRLGLA